MKALTKVVSKTEEGAWLSVYVPDFKQVENYYDGNGLAYVDLQMLDKRMISPDQRKKWFALVGDISIYTGYPTDYLHNAFKYMYQMYFEFDEIISMGNTNMTTAKEMINFLLEWCFDNEIPLAKDTGHLFQGEELWTYGCFKNRICVVCGKHADRHHVLGSKVGMGNNRNKISNVGREFLPLCRVHHNEIEAGSEIEYCNKHHLKPIKLTEKQCEELKL